MLLTFGRSLLLDIGRDVAPNIFPVVWRLAFLLSAMREEGS